MQNQDNLNKEPKEKPRFIREKIVRQPISRGERLRRFLRLCMAAVVFGLVAAVTFAVSAPFVKKCLGEETTEKAAEVSIPKDEETEPVQVKPTEESVTAETKPIEEIVRKELQNFPLNMEDFVTLTSVLKAAADEADKGIVTVSSIIKSTDLFDNPVETADQYAGAVIAATSGELLILTVDDAIAQADAIHVRFGNGTMAEGTVRGKDNVSGLAVIAVDKTQIDKEYLGNIKILELGNSFLMKQGDFILAVGSPAGMIHSASYGVVNYIKRDAQIVDGNTRLMYIDAHSQASNGTFLLNVQGQIIGWATDDFKNEKNGYLTIGRSISEYKGILEKMSNGIPAPYLGIMAQEVGEQQQKAGMPRGIYVTRAVADGPAYEAGIQSGDIITRIGGKEILSMKDFQNQMEALRAGEEITVSVMRSSVEEYAEIKFQIIIGAR